VIYKKQLRVFAVLTAVLGMMALSSATAGAAWLESGVAIGANKTVEFGMHVEGKLTVANESNLEILCASVASLPGEPVELVNGTTEAKGKIKFNTCKVWQNGKNISANCTPLEPIFAGIKAQLFLSGGKNYVLVSPLTGTVFAEVIFFEPCALPTLNLVKGALVFECLKNSNLEPVDCKQEEAVHLAKPNETFTDKLTYGGKAATLSGIASANLASANSWCGHI
jgi:hypothetical protein